jgi:hypothetical protein
MLAFLDHAERHYRRADGSPTHEIDEYTLIICYVRELYGETPAVAFGPLALKAGTRLHPTSTAQSKVITETTDLPIPTISLSPRRARRTIID